MMADEIEELIAGAMPKAARPTAIVNNPGNLRPVGGAGFQQFSTPEEGIAAADKNLQIYGEKHGINTLRGVISRWAPTTDKNDTESYINTVSKKIGLDPNQQIDLSDPVQRHIISGAMFTVEKGSKNIFKGGKTEAVPVQTGDEIGDLIMNAKPVKTTEPSTTQKVIEAVKPNAPLVIKKSSPFAGSRGDVGIMGESKDGTVFGGTPVENIAGALETGASGLYNMGVGLVGKGKGIVESLTTSPEGTYTSGKALEYASKVAKEFEDKYGWSPKLAKTAEYQQALGQFMQNAKIPEIIPEAMALSATAGPASQQLKQAFKARKAADVAVPTATILAAPESVPVPAVVRKAQQEAKTVRTPQGMTPEQVAQMQATFEAKKGGLLKAPAPAVEPGFTPPPVAPVAPTESDLKGVGAAAVPEANLRIQRAQELPIPIELSKDQVTRDPADVRFARETAKDPVFGQQLQEHYARQNDLIQKNLDHMVETTGAEFSGLNPVELGKKLVDVVEPNRFTRKREIEQTYAKARLAGEMAEPVNITPLQNFVKTHEAEAINAPVIKSLEVKLNTLAKDGQLSLNDIEEVRKMVGRLSQDTKTNANYGRQINKIIDKITENKGGESYKAARKLHADFMTEFENTPVMKNITALKKGNSTQRAVAMEDLIQKSVIGSTRDDTMRLFDSLSRMGPEGEQMVNELKGAVAQRIKDQATKNVQLDINGKPYVSTAALNNIITDLDKSGKLELFFGKKGAEHYRTLNQVTKEIQTVPVGTTNPSGTGATLLAAMAEMGLQGAATGVPVPVAMISKHLYGKHQTAKKLRKVSEFVNNKEK
jgi:hypothetical protein